MATPMAIAVIVPEEEEYAPLVRHAAESDLLIVDLQHLVLALRHDVANAEAATKIAQDVTERLRADRMQGIADIRELLERFERRERSPADDRLRCGSGSRPVALRSRLLLVVSTPSPSPPARTSPTARAQQPVRPRNEP